MDIIPIDNLPETIVLWPEGGMPGATQKELPRLTYYQPSKDHSRGPSVLICPGGGYCTLASSKEGHRGAQLLAYHGYAAAVLEYRHAPERHPIPLLDARRALRSLRRLAGERGLMRDAVGVLGFSAGGHLAGLLSTSDSAMGGEPEDPVGQENPIPDFTALVYPVISFINDYAHGWSRDCLLGVDAAEDVASEMSIQNRIDQKTPPMFIAHGQNDVAVSVSNSLALYSALNTKGVVAEMHLYPDMPHGIGFGAHHPWVQSFLSWLPAGVIEPCEVSVPTHTTSKSS
jgi:acetyl esterase/lipase